MYTKRHQGSAKLKTVVSLRVPPACHSLHYERLETSWAVAYRQRYKKTNRPPSQTINDVSENEERDETFEDSLLRCDQRVADKFVCFRSRGYTAHRPGCFVAHFALHLLA